MEKLKCESCGANLKIDDDKEYATCPYCNLKYKLKRDTNLNLKLELDDETRETLKKGGGFLLKVGSGYFIISCIVCLVIILLVVFGFVKIFSLASSQIDNRNLDNSVVDRDSSFGDDMEIQMFNGSYELYSGSQSKFFIESLLDLVVANNRKNGAKIISVVYNDINTSSSDEINELKGNLVDKDYQVSLDYDDNGFVNKIILSD